MTSSLNADYRLRHRWQFLKFFESAEVFRLRDCIVFRVPNGLEHFRLGITLKAKGSSVERNQVKRQVREAFRRLNRELGGFDYNVVIPKQKKLSYPYPQRLRECIDQELPKQLRRSRTGNG